jgi:hypothetical protein
VLRRPLLAWAFISACSPTLLYAQATCPSQGSCLSSHQNPGCENVACCQLVCSADPFCCATQWDSYCADEGWAYCAASCAGPLAGDCLTPHEDPACLDAGCCSSVCDADPFCCEQQWDEVCVEEAVDICVLSCGGSLAGDCLVPHENPSCNESGCCDEVCAVDSYCCQAMWDDVCASEAWDMCVTCGTPASGSCYAPHGPGCNNELCCETVCSYDSFCCLVEWDAYCVDGADLLCAPCGVVSAGSCFAPHGQGCDDEACCLAVCVVDSFCCVSAWDATCVGEAIELCSACGSPAAADCFVASTTPFCNDATCCEAVCGLDDFCCTTQWDDLCALAALQTCGGCGLAESGSCLSAHQTGGCDDLQCCATTCESDPFCCDMAWDQFCVAAAADGCEFAPCYGVCEGDFDANGIVDASDMAVLLGAWNTANPCGDTNGDGVVNSSDLAILLGRWGACEE